MIERIICCALVTFISLTIQGCGFYGSKSDERYTINIGRPLVHSRESLLLDRKEDIRWLTGELTPPEHGVQGKRYTREYSALTGTLKVQADPTVIAEYKAAQAFDLENIARAEELTGKQHQTNLIQEEAKAKSEALKAELYSDTLEFEAEQRSKLVKEYFDILQENIVTACTGEGEDKDEESCGEAKKAFTDAVDQFYGAQLETFAGALKPDDAAGTVGLELTKDDEGNITYKFTGIQGDMSLPDLNSLTKETVDSIAALGKQIEATKTATKVTPPSSEKKQYASDIKVTPIENFEDKLAYRTRVRDQIAETRLDERHDTFGNTLYRLQFPIEVLPEEENPNWAKIEIEIRPESTMFLPPGMFQGMYTLAKRAQDTAYNNFLQLENFEEKKTDIEHLHTLKEYYKRYDKDLHGSIDAWTEMWLAVMRVEFEKKYDSVKKYITKPETRTLSHDDQTVSNMLDRNIGTFCSGVKQLIELEKENQTPPYYSTIYTQKNREICGEKKTDNYTFDETVIRSLKDLQESYKAHCNSGKSNQKCDELLQLQNPAIVLTVLQEMEQEYKFQHYADVKYQKEGNFYFLTWKNETFAIKVNETEKEKAIKFKDYGKWRLISDLTTDYVADVYSVNPDESAQRIEDMAEVSKHFGINFAAQFLAGSIGGEAGIQYLKGKEKLFASILRRPVVLSLPGRSLPAECNSENPTEVCKPAGIRFGWVIGPVFRIKNDRQDAEFFQTATKKTVSADVSLPAWWKSLNIIAHSSWVSAKSLRQRKEESYDLATRAEPFYLPARQPDFEELLRVSPRAILNPAKKQNITLRPGNKENSLLIEGKNIWRVDSVSIGNDVFKGDAIEILGAMEAIKVTYSGLTESSCTEPLEVDLCKGAETAVLSKKATRKCCNAPIRLWSRSADSVYYSKNAVIAFDATTVQSDINDIRIEEIKPAPGKIKTGVGNSSPENLNILLTLTGWNLKFDTSKVTVKLGGTDYTVADAQHKIQIKPLPDNRVALAMVLNPEEIWIPEFCEKKFTEQAPKSTCTILVEILYDSIVRTTGTYTLIKQQPSQELDKIILKKITPSPIQFSKPTLGSNFLEKQIKATLSWPKKLNPDELKVNVGGQKDITAQYRIRGNEIELDFQISPDQVWTWQEGCEHTIEETKVGESCEVGLQFLYKGQVLKNARSESLEMKLKKPKVSVEDITITVHPSTINIFKPASGIDYPPIEHINLILHNWPDEVSPEGHLNVWVGSKKYSNITNIKPGKPMSIIVDNVDPNDIWGGNECKVLGEAGDTDKCQLEVELHYKGMPLINAKTNLLLKVAKPVVTVSGKQVK